ncbi:MAG: hypothetical protein Q8930_11565 [Bacillota bacterium]|nr:hypothetical protein [Bacillota bacterium]
MDQYYYPYNFMNNGICPCCEQPPCMRSPQYREYSDPEPLVKLPDSWTFGPLKIEWAFSGESINVVLKAFEEAVKDVILSLSKPSLTITTSIGETTINLKINADFTNNQITINGAACFDTVCTAFNNTVIAKW